MNTLDDASLRNLLKQALSGATLLSACGRRKLPAAESGETAEKSRVVVARDVR